MKERHLILGIGELLWDMLPQGPALGGAPANFAVMAARLGNHSAILSRIGRDDLGRKAIGQLDPMPADTSCLQIDPVHETGRVTVSFKAGEPQYTIHEPAAWDFLELSDEWLKLAERADAFCFGSLAQRSEQSRSTIQTMAAETPASCIRVFDVNLRAPYFSAEVVQESLELATVLKLNENEMPQVLNLLGFAAAEGPEPERLRLGATRLLDEFPELDLVAVTRGAQGSLLVRRDEWHEHPGIRVPIADAVGAGDAFTAGMIHALLHGAGLAALNEAGNCCGAWVASQAGAMPALPDDIRADIQAAIEG